MIELNTKETQLREPGQKCRAGLESSLLPTARCRAGFQRCRFASFVSGIELFRGLYCYQLRAAAPSSSVAVWPVLWPRPSWAARAKRPAVTAVGGKMCVYTERRDRATRYGRAALVAGGALPNINMFLYLKALVESLLLPNARRRAGFQRCCIASFVSGILSYLDSSLITLGLSTRVRSTNLVQLKLIHCCQIALF